MLEVRYGKESKDVRCRKNDVSESISYLTVLRLSYLMPNI